MAARLERSACRSFSPLTVRCGAASTMVSVKLTKRPFIRPEMTSRTVTPTATPPMVRLVWRRCPRRWRSAMGKR
ncbi:hypothetical protein D3C87_1775600 [compost metagenome]